jgi:hypothetical protein
MKKEKLVLSPLSLSKGAHFFALGRAKKPGQENAREAVFRGLTARRDKNRIS